MHSIISKPNLFIVGAPKCGTTSMYHYLSQHPDIFMSRQKEINFFGKDFIWKNSDGKVDSIDNYLNFFKNANNKKIVGEASATYIYSNSACNEIYDFNPNSKIIIMLRNPIDMVISMHRQLLFTGNENENDLLEAIQLERSRRAMKNIPPMVDIINKLFYIENIKSLPTRILMYYNKFGNNNVHIVLLEDLSSNPSQEYLKILSFLQLEGTFDPSYKIYNKGKIYRYRSIRKFIKQYSEILGKFRGLFLSKPIGIMKLLERMNAKEIVADTNPETIIYIKEQLYETLDVIGSLIKRDISHWKN
mgnify:CR=1 FL=1